MAVGVMIMTSSVPWQLTLGCTGLGILGLAQHT